MTAPVTDRGQYSFTDGAVLWQLDAATLNAHGLEAATVADHVPELLDLVHSQDEEVSVSNVAEMLQAHGPFTAHYRIRSAGAAERSLMLVGQVGHDDPTGDGVSGYIVDMTTHLSRAANEAVTANNEARAVIEQAKGAYMMAYGITEDEAFAVLKSLSSRTNAKLRDVALKVVSLMNEPDHRELHCSQTLLNVSQRVLAWAER